MKLSNLYLNQLWGENMKNTWLKVNDKNLIEGLNLMARDDMIKVVIDGTKVQTKVSFMEQIERKLSFPTGCAGKFSRFEDWIRDLSWLSEEKGVCIWITDYEGFMKEDTKSKGIIEEIFKEEVLPFWETEVVKNVKGGKPREFYIITS